MGLKGRYQRMRQREGQRRFSQVPIVQLFVATHPREGSLRAKNLLDVRTEAVESVKLDPRSDYKDMSRPARIQALLR